MNKENSRSRKLLNNDLNANEGLTLVNKMYILSNEDNCREFEE